MTHYFTDVPGLGNVAFSRHALDRLKSDNISEEIVRQVLYKPTKPDVPDSKGIIWREDKGIRLVILMSPTPFRGARLVKTAYRVLAQYRARY